MNTWIHSHLQICVASSHCISSISVGY